MHPFNFKEEHPASDHIIIKFIESGYGSQPRSGEFAKGMKIEAVDGSTDEIDDYPSEGEYRERRV